jgi:hypothetical protein
VLDAILLEGETDEWGSGVVLMTKLEKTPNATVAIRNRRFSTRARSSRQAKRM